MTDGAIEIRSVIVERDLPHPVDKVWRALTQPALMAEWLMKSDFKPQVGHRFAFSADWGSIDCEVLAIKPNEQLAYTWAAHGLESTVTFTLVPSSKGTHLCVEQRGFRSDQPHFYEGAKGGWPRFLDALEQALAKIS